MKKRIYYVKAQYSRPLHDMPAGWGMGDFGNLGSILTFPSHMFYRHYFFTRNELKDYLMSFPYFQNDHDHRRVDAYLKEMDDFLKEKGCYESWRSSIDHMGIFISFPERYGFFGDYEEIERQLNAEEQGLMGELHRRFTSGMSKILENNERRLKSKLRSKNKRRLKSRLAKNKK